MSEASFFSYNPEGELVEEYYSLNESELEKKILIAEGAFQTHKTSSLKERMEKL